MIRMTQLKAAVLIMLLNKTADKRQGEGNLLPAAIRGGFGQIENSINSDEQKKEVLAEMKMSDLVAQYIMRLLDESDGNCEIKRNELANALGCVPSQINYVITSRFTPEQGYIVESRRGGGGYVRIIRVETDKRVTMMHIVNSIGDSISAASSGAILGNLVEREMISEYDYAMIAAAISDRAYSTIPQEYRDTLRAAILKNMLITHVMFN